MGKPLYYTFGNHMHWVDMQWLWGYDVLPGSVRDMLRLVEEAGARGNVNFDGVGYEKLAAEDPEALQDLRRAVDAGTIEVVGGSYGQPYGLFHGGESNVRQLVFGARAVQRLLGVRPRAFWEEEFYFFPQLPQMLRECGYTGASLFFQWTWHTPTVPEEAASLVEWEGLDGSRLLALPRNELCLHQWPEDFEGRLDGELAGSLANPAVVQWVELYPSPDWMCRSEVLLPRLRELMQDERFDVRSGTLSELITSIARAEKPETRRYTLDDFFHGMSLGKNGDHMPRRSRECEQVLLAAEAAASLAGLFGRPYASWRVYPTWELDESWRELLAAQHHDNHECEGLCGEIGETSFERSLHLSTAVLARTLDQLAGRIPAGDGRGVAFNTLGWTRDVATTAGIVRDVPAFGYRVVGKDEELTERFGPVSVDDSEDELVIKRDDLELVLDRRRGLLKQITSADFPAGLLAPDRPIGELSMVREGREDEFEEATLDLLEDEDGVRVVATREGRGGSLVQIEYDLSPLHQAVWMSIEVKELGRPDGGMHAGLQTPIEPSFEQLRLLHDHPYGWSEVEAARDHVRKYPEGDWMTTPQWFETVRRPFTAHSYVDLLAADARTERGLLVVHDGAQAFFRTDDGVRQLLSMYDPWDGDFFGEALYAQLWLMPHAELSGSERARIAAECNELVSEREARGGEEGDLPRAMSAVQVEGRGVLVTALYRENRANARYAGGAFQADVEDPFVVRVVELDGRSTQATLTVPGRVARAARTDPHGAVLRELEVSAGAEPPLPDSGVEWSRVRLDLRAFEIATVMLDVELARHAPRNLDDFRHVWSSVHRREG